MGRKSRSKRERQPDDGRWHFTRRGDVLFVGKRPTAAKEAWVAQHRSRFKPGVFTVVEVVHEPGCKEPIGFACSCALGPHMRVQGDTPEAN